ncbi:MAG: O-antigen ligase family protein [Anaerolineae bacterium]|nr:O-antigen ligase family protein [Anaerolineae bacterium]
MKQDRSVFLQSLNLPSSWNKWFLAFFLGMAILAGGVAAVAGAQLGWVGLLAIPVLFFVLAILIRPELGLAAFVFIVYIQLNLVLGKYRPGIPSPALLLLGALIFLIIWRMVIYGDRPVGWKRASIILLVITGWFFSVLVADNSTLALLKLQKFLENAILAFVVVFFVQKPGSFRRIIWTLLLAGIFMASISVFQNLTSTYGNNYWGFGGWNEATTAGTSNHRLTGPYGNPNGYAQVLVLLVPLALDRLWHEKNFRLRLLAGYALAVCALTIFFTYSRNGFLTLVFTLGFLVVMRRPRIMPLALSVAMGIILFQFLPASYTQRITTLFQFSSSSGSQVSDASFQGRISENVAAWRMFQDHPIFGVGLDNFQVNYQIYSRKIGLDSRRDPRAPASFYLELLSEQGLVGFSVFMAFMAVVFRSLWRAHNLFQFLGMKTEEYMSLAFMSGLAGYMVFYISKNSAYPNVFWILLGIAFSIAQVAENSVHSLRSESRGSL